MEWSYNLVVHPKSRYLIIIERLVYHDGWRRFFSRTHTIVARRHHLCYRYRGRCRVSLSTARPLHFPLHISSSTFCSHWFGLSSLQARNPKALWERTQLSKRLTYTRGNLKTGHSVSDGIHLHSKPPGGSNSLCCLSKVHGCLKYPVFLTGPLLYGLGSKSKHCKDTCLQAIGLRLQNIDNYSPFVDGEHKWEGLCMWLTPQMLGSIAVVELNKKSRDVIRITSLGRAFVNERSMPFQFAHGVSS